MFLRERYQVAWGGVKNKGIIRAAQTASLRSDAKYRDSGFAGRLQVLCMGFDTLNGDQ